MRKAGMVQDAPSWTCVVQAYLKQRMPQQAVEVRRQTGENALQPYELPVALPPTVSLPCYTLNRNTQSEWGESRSRPFHLKAAVSEPPVSSEGSRFRAVHACFI